MCGMLGAIALIMTACGGGGGSAGTTGPTGGDTTNGSISVVLTNSVGVAANTISGSDSLTVTAKLKKGTGAVAANEIVTFTVSNDLATISPTSATALTDANGVATVSMKSAGNGAGAATITATSTVTGAAAAVSAAANFQVGASLAATPVAVNFVSAVPSDSSIVIQGSGGNGRTEVALLTFKVVDNANAGIASVPVSFTLNSSAPVTLVSTSGITDADGQVSVSLKSGTKPTTVRVIAKVTGTSISTMSDTITVTTGQPVQTAFSLSMEKHNPEGWNYDNTQVKVIALLADANGQAVAQGTQVVFTTDAGAIFGTAGAYCLTDIKGECTVTWRSQNPRPSSGQGTITATATNGTQNLSASQSFFMSGSWGYIHYPASGASVSYIPLSFAASCDPQTIQIRVSDVNNNPMPVETKLSMANGTNASATIFPDSVADIGPGGASASGTTHNVTVTPSGCDLAGAKTVTGSIYIAIESPNGNVQYWPINLGSFKTAS